MKEQFDIVVIGGGHAGVEAALAVSRMGRSAAIVTMEAGKLALMSCNPAIGGIGKSQLVKEIDAMGGVMGEAIDASGIQFRRLNLSKGPAVWSTRAQADRAGYNQFIVDYVAKNKNISVIEGLAEEIIANNGKASAVKLEDGRILSCGAIIVTTGTFLGAKIHIGEESHAAGRLGEKSATKLSSSFLSFGFELGRLKTGTPPRLSGNSIDWSRCQIQPGETPIPFFSRRTKPFELEQTPCYLTRTSARTKEIILANLECSAMFSGKISGTGPRYCPSIEDKFFRFNEKESHQIFLEPEGNGTDEVYPNGFSTSLPESVQREAIKTVIGLESAEITKPGYAVEYDYCPANQILPTLETRRVPGLFLAGQINGTSGYEEAAAQGLMAGINAVLLLNGEKPFILDRSTAYIGVMIDDLVTRSTTEPYRMFTSRAEYRLALREDNAYDRLSEKAFKLGLISESTFTDFEVLRKQTDELIASFGISRLWTDKLPKELAGRFQSKKNVSIADLIRLPNVPVEAIGDIVKRDFPNLTYSEKDTLTRAYIQIRYHGYIAKQSKEIAKFKKLEKEPIPKLFDYDSVVGLKHEANEKFKRFRPVSLGQAGRIEGVTPGDISVLSVYLKKVGGILSDKTV